MIPESPHNNSLISPMNQRPVVSSPQMLHPYAPSQIPNQSLLQPNQFYDDFLRPNPMPLPPWEDFVKIETSSEMFGEFACANNNLSNTGGTPLPSILDEIGQQTSQFTVPCVGLGGTIQDSSGLPPSTHSHQHRYSAFKMNYPHPSSFHHRSYPPSLHSHEHGNLKIVLYWDICTLVE